jgi:hypothetical protein
MTNKPRVLRNCAVMLLLVRCGKAGACCRSVVIPLTRGPSPSRFLALGRGEPKLPERSAQRHTLQGLMSFSTETS